MAKFSETDKDKAFARLWLEAWNWPDAWSRKAIDADKSPYTGFSEWLNATGSRQVSLELLERVLVRFREADGDVGRYGPRLFLIRQAYEQAAHRGRGRGGDRHNLAPCEACDSSGVVLVPVVRVRGGGLRLLTEPVPATHVSTTAFPCLCERGRALCGNGRNPAWQAMDEDTRRRGFAARLRPVDLPALEAECRRLAGFHEPDQRPEGREDPEFERRVRELFAKYTRDDVARAFDGARAEAGQEGW